MTSLLWSLAFVVSAAPGEGIANSGVAPPPRAPDPAAVARAEKEKVEARCRAFALEHLATPRECPTPDPALVGDAIRNPSAAGSATYVQFQGAIPGAVSEALSLLVEIAVDKAKRDGLELVRARARDAVCGIKAKIGDKNEVALFPSTCALLSQVSLERLASNPEPIRAALVDDLLLHVIPLAEASGPKLAKAPPVAVRPLIDMAFASARSALVRSPATFGPADAWALVGALLESVDGLTAGLDPRPKVVVEATLRALRACVRIQNADPTAKNACDPVVLARAAIEGAGASFLATDLPEVIRLVTLGQRALLGGESGAGAADAGAQAVLRFRDAVELVFAVLAKVAPDLPHVAQIEELVLAAVDRNTARVLGLAAELLATLIDDDARKGFHKASLVLAAIGSYAETFDRSAAAAGDDAASSKEGLRQARKEILENLVAAATVRTDRHGEAVWSLGMPVGFMAGWQWLREPPATAGGSTSFSGRHGMAPQLELPLGVAFEVLPGKDYPIGFHAMALALDLGQYASYDEEGQVARPRWDTLLSPGAQVGVALGSPSNVFVLGLEGRYAPTLFSAEGDVAPRTGGAIRVGAFLAYFVPLFDFN